MQLSHFIRRHKWRLRPLKKIVLPFRNARRTLVALTRRTPVIVRTSANAVEIYPAEKVQPITSSVHLVQESAPARIFQFREIDFWGRYGGSVVTSDHKLIAELSPDVWGVENHPIFSSLRLPRSERLDRRTAIAVTPEAPGNYYHWLIDLLPRLLLLRDFAGSFAAFDRILLNGSRSNYELESLAAIGAPLSKIVYVGANKRFQIVDATFASMDQDCAATAPWKVRALRNLAPHSQSAPPRRLYLSRRSAAVRRVVNEEALAELLRAHDFEILDLEKIAWRDQVERFAGASVIIAPHGAALANIAFCPPGTRVIEFSTRAGYRDFYPRLAAAAALQYEFIEAQPVVTATASHRAVENDDMIVDPLKLRAILESL